MNNDDDVTTTPLTNDDDNKDCSNPGGSSSSSSSSSSQLLDQFVGLLHESLTNAAAAAQDDEKGEEVDVGEERRDPKLRSDSSSSTSSSVVQFQSLTVDFAPAAAAAGSKKAMRTKKDPASANPNVPPPPLSGSVKRITGRLVRLAQVGGKRQRHKTPDNSSDAASASSRHVVLQVTHKYHGATDIVKNYPVDTASHSVCELLNWMLLHMDRRQQIQQQEGKHVEDGERRFGGGSTDAPDTVRSVATEWGIANVVPAQPVTMRGTLDTTAGRYLLTVPPRSRLKKQQHSPSLQHTPNVAGPAPATAIREHDRPKNRKVCIEDEFWRSVGVTTTTGSGPRPAVNVKPDMIAKVRQCEKFVEIVSNLVREVTTASGGSSPNGGDVRITDLGCGKGYLTYALHSYLQNQQQRQNDKESNGALYYLNVTSTGIDIRPKLVRDLNQIVSDLRIDGLRFEQGSIQDACLCGAADATAGEPDKADISVQVFIALHACDTATDDALFSAIQRGADVIVTAPCCHKQLRPQINDLIVGGSTSKNVHALADVLRHGIYRERTSETVTDAIRAMLLELAGYKTGVFEFVGGEHTAKNCMITGVRRPKRPNAKDQDDIRNRIRSLAEFYGIRQHKLAGWMGEESLLMQFGRDDDNKVSSPPPARKSIRNMPPL